VTVVSYFTAAVSTFVAARRPASILREWNVSINYPLIRRQMARFF
jgi:hypothetical protein